MILQSYCSYKVDSEKGTAMRYALCAMPPSCAGITHCPKLQATMFAILVLFASAFRVGAQDTLSVTGPNEHVFSKVGDVELKAYIFRPAVEVPATIILFKMLDDIC